MGKGKLITYWIATGLLALGMLQSGIFAVLRTKQWIDIITPLGYPVYFLTILGVWKILGVIAILVPRFPLLKEWAYAGFFFAMTGALFSHLQNCHFFNVSTNHFLSLAEYNTAKYVPGIKYLQSGVWLGIGALITLDCP